MSTGRRSFLKALGLTGLTLAAGKEKVYGSEAKSDTEFYGVLYDSTRCVGCQTCEVSCAEANGQTPPEDTPEAGKVRKTTDKYRTVINAVQTENGEVYVKTQSMHCNEPACAAACLTQAMHKTHEGAVIWRGNKCMGCRYCMVSCPFDMPKFEYHSYNPKIEKCTMCNDRTQKGEKPACVANCPADALMYGSRRELIKEARKRIIENPAGDVDDGAVAARALGELLEGVEVRRAVDEDRERDLAEVGVAEGHAAHGRVEHRALELGLADDELDLAGRVVEVHGGLPARPRGHRQREVHRAAHEAEDVLADEGLEELFAAEGHVLEGADLEHVRAALLAGEAALLQAASLDLRLEGDVDVTAEGEIEEARVDLERRDLHEARRADLVHAGYEGRDLQRRELERHVLEGRPTEPRQAQIADADLARPGELGELDLGEAPRPIRRKRQVDEDRGREQEEQDVAAPTQCRLHSPFFSS